MERFIKPTYDELESYVENLQKQLVDAQATIAALQARVRTATQFIIAEIGASGPEDLEEAVGRIVGQLQQRTAELEAAKAESNAYYRKAIEFEHELYGDPGHGLGLVHVEKELKKEREALKASLQLAHGRVKFLEDKNTAVQAELERVRLLSSHNERRLEEVDKKYKELHGLLLALPKVEGEIRVIEVATDEWHVYDTIFATKAGADNYAALLQHRQGMEG